MAINSYEELMQVAEDRRSDTLTLEVDISGGYSAEHEKAKQELAQAKAIGTLTGGGFLSDNLAVLEQRVEDTRPEPKLVWVRFQRLELKDWALLTKNVSLNAVDQYEKVLPKTFVGIWGVDPDTGAAALSTDPALLSSTSGKGILPGGHLHHVVQTFISWQNSSGNVTIHPTKSGRD